MRFLLKQCGVSLFLLGLFFVLLVTALPFRSANAQTGDAALQYTPLENLPGFPGLWGDFKSYFTSLYLLALWIVGISSLFMLVVGGFLYLSSAGNTALLGTAKKTLWGAVIGLVIALISWLLLNTINSDLTSLHLSGLSIGNSGASVGQGSSGGPASGNTDKAGCEALQHMTVPAQCNLASTELVKILSCMEGKGITNTVFSLTSNGTSGDQVKSAACCGHSTAPGGSCPHSKVTCHHGCTFGTQGLSYAADIATAAGASDGTLCHIATIAKSCGAGNIWGARTLSCGIKQQNGHQTHLHVSVAGCQH